VPEDLLAELLLLALVDGHDGVEDLELVADLAPRADGGAQVLRKAAAAEARTRVQELRPDARVRAHALAHLLDVGAQQLAQVRQIVHERDARREHRVRGVLRELGRAAVHDQ